MLTAVSLVRKGYIPRELPQAFTSTPLGDLLNANPGALPLAASPTECTRHNLARLSGFRRPLKVPNPRSYIRLAQVLETHWADIEAHCNSQRIAISRPVVTRTAERAVRPRFRFGEKSKLRPRLWRGQKYVLFSDVGQFYSSLYTHAIPWALHTKPFAKANRNNTKGDDIDRELRGGQSGQTIGIPIGPDTSFVVAEIVLTAVDGLVKQKIQGYRGFRYLDDYEAAFPTRAEAEEAQGHLESALGDFELVINPFKTRVVELPQPFQTTWTREISTFPIRTATSRQALNDIISLFSRSAEIARQQPGALRYTLLKGMNVQVDALTWPTFQALVWSAVSSEPTTMATAVDLLLVKSQQVGVPINPAGAAEVVEALILRHAPLRNGSEVAWALWAAITFQINLSTAAAEAVSAMEDDFVALLALDADSRGLFPAAALDRTAWEALINYNDVMSGPNWLMAYEGTIKGWLGSAAQWVAADPFFSVLQQNNVYFYDRNPPWTPFTGPAGPLPGGPVPDSYL